MTILGLSALDPIGCGDFSPFVSFGLARFLFSLIE